MSLRRFAPLALVLGAACSPSVPNQAPPDTVAYAVSFPDASDGTQFFQPPLPNDLILNAATTTTLAGVPAAQAALLKAFAKGGGWPNDQEVPIQIVFYQVKVDPAGGPPTSSATAPDIDAATVNASTVAIVRYDVATPTKIPVGEATYATTTTPTPAGAAPIGVLTVRRQPDPATGTRWWAPGRYAVALRGGKDGVKTRAGQPIAAQTSTLLISQDKDLTQPENQSLLASQPDPAAAGAKLEQSRRLYATPTQWGDTAFGWVPQPSTTLTPALKAVDAVFPHRDVATIQTFVVDPSPHVALDPTAGVVPLPSEFLMTPEYYASATGGTIQEVPAFGALAPGIAQLDGFSTTAMILAPTSGNPISAPTVTGSSVLLFKQEGAAWVRVPDFTPATPTGTYLTVPPPITVDLTTGQPCAPPYGASCVAKVIGLQPAVPVPLPGDGYHALPPLDEKARYAVVLTSAVKDVTGAGLSPGTLSKILAIAGDPATPIVVGGRSQLAGVSDATAQQLAQLAPALHAELTTGLPFQPSLLSAITGAGLDPNGVAMAYTFRTQTIGDVAKAIVGLPAGAGLPMVLVSAGGTPLTTVTPLDPAAAARRYGVLTAPLKAGTADFVVKNFIDERIVTLDLLDPANGAFRSDPATATPEIIRILIAVPLLPQPANGYPLVVFHHGLGGGRAHMMLISGALAGSGMVVAAIDAAKHGDRSWCSKASDCASGSCDTSLFGDQGDGANKPGLCTGAGGLAEAPVVAGIPACGGTVQTDCWDGTGGIAKVSGNYFSSGNLFRTRDTMRQDVIDEAAVARALTSPVFAAQTGVAIDATKVFFVGQSLGSIEGAVDLAVNPAFSRAVLNVGGGTFVDIANNSPAFKSTVDALLAGLGIQPGSAAYLQFVQVSKLVLDPADPVNFAGTLATSGKTLFGQAARCDSVVPNAQNGLFYGLLGLQPDDPTASAAAPTLEWYMKDTSTPCPADGSTGNGGATHGFLLDFVNQSLTTKAQTNAALFLLGQPVAATPVTP